MIVLQPNTDVDQFELVIAKAGFLIKGKGDKTYTSTDLVHLVHGVVKDHRRLFFEVIKESVD